MESLDDAKIDSRLIKQIHNSTSIHVKIDDDFKTDKITIKTGVKQRDTISTKRFTLGLASKNWQKITIDGVHLNNLRFADDIVIIANTGEKLNNVPRKLHRTLHYKLDLK